MRLPTMQSNLGSGVGAFGLLSTNSRMAGVKPRSSTVLDEELLGLDGGGARQTARTSSGSRKPAIVNLIFVAAGAKMV